MEKVEQANRPRGSLSFGNFLALAMLGIVSLGLAAPCYAAPDICNGEVTNKALPIGAEPPDLLVEHTCKLTGTLYYYNHVNIIAGGKLIFVEPPTAASPTSQDFWAASIIVENGGEMLAGVDQPYGTNGKTMTIHLYGPDPAKNDVSQPEGPGVPCASPLTDAQGNAVSGPCGIPLDVWNSNGTADLQLPGGVTDRFYQYGPLHDDTNLNTPNAPPNPQQGYFGYKVLAVSYGGTLQLRGLKGTSLTHAPNPAAPEGSPGRIGDIAVLLKQPEELTAADEPIITNSGADWARLAQYDAKTKELTLDRNVGGDWMEGDEIVVTPTDYFPDHYEVRKLTSDATGSTIQLNEALEHDHSDKQYDIGAKIGTAQTAFRAAFEKVDGSDPAFLEKAETRAAVALLTRSIRIVSAGDAPDEQFPDPAKPPGPSYMYGGHVVFRAGFNRVQIQGVEFKQLGQGGLMGRYPVHFHIARRVPADTYVIDSSVNESMTRWMVLHSTLGVTLARNVGFKSIGHGYFLEDATETDNKFYSNIGIDARAAVVSNDNPRNIPGLLVAHTYSFDSPLKYDSDASYPTAFWITNGWNALTGNMAAGVGACGACYWYVSAANHDMVETNMANPTPMAWSGYSAIQADPAGPTTTGQDKAGLSPVRLFYKNYCSTAEHALSVTDGSPCTSVAYGKIAIIPNPRNQSLEPGQGNAEPDVSRMYFPRYGGNRHPTYCDDSVPGSCQKTTQCSLPDPKDCVPSVFSHLTSQFNWAETNFSAIWLRSGFLLLDHTFLSDIQGPGVTFVTGGDYRRSNLPRGYWGIVSDSIFVGQTQADPFASDGGDQSSAQKLPCTWDVNGCLYTNAGVAYPLSNFGVGERMYNVYDGPAYEDTNAYLDIKPVPCKSLETCMYYNTLGVRQAQSDFGGFTKGEGYLPNAAIGWKQSNGFYYPPAFHSQNLFFGDVDIRHYVVEPLTYPGTYVTNVPLVQTQYAGTGSNDAVFLNWSDVDRQTELSDDDGSLTGFTQSISVNEDPFFRAPSQTAQCRSNLGIGPDNACADQQTPLPNPVTARTSPYDHITTALFPLEGTDPPQPYWGLDCTHETCTGVPIYRQYLTGTKGDDAATSTREWQTWMTNDCDKQYKNLLGQTRPLPASPPDRYPAVPTPRDAFEKFDAQCPSPFVRMAGMAFGQRSVLTVNNGKYFIDTTQSEKFQRNTSDLDSRSKPSDRSINLFQPGKTYFVYFLFAKKNTKQIYQIYGGPSFLPSMIKGVRVNIDAWHVPESFTPWNDMPWTVKHDDDNDPPGVVHVEVDFSQIPQTDDADNLDPANVKAGDTCQPSSYCKADLTNNTCGCDTSKLGALAKLSPNYVNVCENVCHHWAVQDIDCPKGGCFGFQFTTASDFVADDTFHRPKPMPYPTNDSNGPSPWATIKLTPTTTAPDNATEQGACYYKTVPSDDKGSTCKVAD